MAPPLVPQFGDDLVVVGAGHHPLRDVYHLLLRATWPVAFAVISGTFILLNLLFACAYLVSGGVTNAAPGSFRDAFFFSVQTMGTIGYGAMYPSTNAAHFIVVVEAIVSVMFTALATGIVFARFSRATGLLVFSRNACIAPMNGVPTLMLRIGNDRSNTIVEATVRAVLVRTEKTSEGIVFYRMHELELARERTPALARSWTVMHPITAKSPLCGATPSSCTMQEVELIVTVAGTDDTVLQPVHGRHRYMASDVVWGARLADVLSELPDGRMQLDVRRFHDLTPTQPTESFPFPASTS